jgi:putative transposase
VSLTSAPAALLADRRHQPNGGTGGWVGVDRGLTAYVVAARADGTEVQRVDDPPRPARTGMARQRRLARNVTRKQPGSNNRGKAAARLGRHHTRVAATRRRFLHEVSNRLVKTHDRLAIETLTITGMLTNRHLAAAVADAAWAELARIIGYKQQWRGGRFIPVDRWYPSTKTCAPCRTVVAAMPLHQRTFACHACGYQADRDLNAAVNLAIWAEQHHAQVRDLPAGGPVTNARRGKGSNGATGLVSVQGFCPVRVQTRFR